MITHRYSEAGLDGYTIAIEGTDRSACVERSVDEHGTAHVGITWPSDWKVIEALAAAESAFNTTFTDAEATENDPEKPTRIPYDQLGAWLANQASYAVRVTVSRYIIKLGRMKVVRAPQQMKSP